MLNIYEEDNVTCAEAIIYRSNRKERSVYSFLVDGMLIDTGANSLESDLFTFYEQCSFDFVVLTHSHEDHTGNASRIQSERNVPIFIHPNGINICAKPGSYPEYRKRVWGERKEFTALPLGKTIQSRQFEWEIIYTPGHADDHVALLNKATGILFSGDLYLDPKTKILMYFESVPVIMNSISKLLSCDFDTMFCSHSGYIPEGKKQLRQKLINLEYLYGEVKYLYNKGLSISEIDNKLFSKKHPIIELSNGEFDTLHIVTSIISDAKSEK
ncbi:MBL fold metallo-hydrolase [Bacillus sp. DTU_2020_1000418_1_SI_GHA_SEK_038]|uniref:MBL fold metallo-hydrolase n=1 Tax=Bacillus sp. DTU_2020_1000418_1_SI_GHA_SEK_038 TaxID=3077585 RepID=UPI0028EFCF43|nr:MBL fold metallo-hydrolase [Bacillus sp. DTU_2020_1000418_1_SI_GHA_SEK_038]WNS76176.1 MBL fold metallo-hydrolase [Bacillus sp. DTU_2020_1000418_1_SI_GHA_SEK_038]